MICGIGCKSVKVHEAVEYLKKNRDIKFDGKIVDVFLEFIAVYPAGSRVRMSNGEIGTVLYQNGEFPDRPVLRIIKDRDGKDVDRVIDLAEIKNVYIETVLD